MESKELFTSKFTAAIGPLFYLCRFFALAPFDRKFNASKLWTTYGILVVVLTLYYCGVEKIILLANSEGKLNVKELGNTIFLGSIINASLITSIVASMVMKREFAKIFKHFVEVDMMLNQDTGCYAKIYFFLCKEVGLFSTFLVCITCYDCIVVSAFEVQWGVLFNYILFEINLVTPLVFSNLVLLLLTKFKALNVRMENIFHELLSNEKPNCNVLFILESKNSSEIVKRENRNTIGRPKDVITEPIVGTQFSADRPTMKKLKFLRKAHFKLYNLSSSISYAFGLRNLAQILFFLGSIVFFANWIITEMLKNASEPRQAFLSLFVWLVLIIFLLVAISILCELAAQEANRTAILVEKSLLLENVGLAISEELEKFARQLTRHKVAFSAGGVFEINTSLLLSVAVAVATYTVLLITVK